MDFSSPTNTKKTEDTDSQTPPSLLLPLPHPHPQPLKSLSFTINGSLNRHQPPPPQKMVVSYKECLKNHAAAIGGHALDGCGEFMPSPSAVPSDPTSLKCAACGCHRNFHRRNPADLYPPRHVSSNNQLHLHLLPSPPPQPLSRNSSPSPSLSPGRSSSPGPTPSPTPSPQSPPPVSHLPPNYSSYFASPPQMLLALSSGGGGLSRPSDEQYQNLMTMNPTAPTSGSENVNARKRFRTKFSQEQKEKMCLFAEKLGWKMQRSEEKMVEEFCKEVGVRKGVLKVWMHNNKHTLGKISSSSGSGLISRVNNVINVDNHHHHQDINTHEDTDDQKDDDGT